MSRTASGLRLSIVLPDGSIIRSPDAASLLLPGGP